MDEHGHAGELAPRLGGFAAAGIGFLCFLELEGWLGPELPAARHFLAAVVVVTAAVVALVAGSCTRALGTLALGLGPAILLQDRFAAVLAFAGAWMLVAPSWAAAARGLVATALVVEAQDHLPVLRALTDRSAEALSELAPLDAFEAGPIALGLPAVLATLSVLTSWGWSERRPRRVLVGLACVVAVEMLYVRVFIRALETSHDSAGEAMAPLRWQALLLALVVAAITGWPRRRTDSAPAASRRLALGSAGCLLGAAVAAPLLQAPATSGRITVLNEGGLDWERPRHGEYGDFTGGMFGLLPVYAEDDGFRFEVIDSAALDDAHLQSTDVFVVVNLPKRWKDAEKAVVGRFLARGGSVLVLGDHTNVFGLRDGLNTLLEDYGASFQFDSAYPVRHPWEVCTRLPLQPLSAWSRPRFHMRHGIGASLRCTAEFTPLLDVPYAFSDKGEPYNYPGAFLGNYSYEVGERLGDLVVAAWRTVGRGKLVVYGDTSAFQNPSLPSSYSCHVLPLLRWLARPAHWGESPPFRSGLGLLLLAVTAAVLFTRRHAPVIAFALAASAAVSLVTLVAHGRSPDAAISASSVVVDRGHLSLTGHYNAHFNAIGALYSNLARAGFRTLDVVDLERPDLENAKAIFLVAPTKPLSERETELLVRYQEHGGYLFLVIGYPHRDACLGLLHAVGADLQPVPLGTIPPRSPRGTLDFVPRMREAWPIQLATQDATTLFRWGDYCSAAFVPRGSGGTVLLADARFFSAENIEGTWGHWPGNIRFLYNLFKEFLGATPEEVQDVFPSPVKPS